jgi:carbamoyltransferase
MRILGIHDGHNSSACLFDDGIIRLVLQEERLRRVKNYAGFPEMAITAILADLGLTMEDIDCFALVGHEMPDQNTKEGRLELYRRMGQPIHGSCRQRLTRLKDPATFVNSAARKIKKAFEGNQSSQSDGRLSKHLAYGIPVNKISIIDHHEAHACAAYHGLGVYDRDILVLTNDGEGDGCCASVSIGTAGKLERIASVHRSHSIGNLYSVVTFLMGMVPLEHEYKLMGMAPYADEGRAEVVAQKFRTLYGNGLQDPYGWTKADSWPDPLYSYSYLRDLLEFDRFDSICAGIQKFTEEFMIRWIESCISATGIRRLAVSGGVFMNVKINKSIMELPEVESVFVFPSCSDESNAIGACYSIAAQHNIDRLKPLKDIYFGRSYSDEQVKAAIDKFNFNKTVKCEIFDDIEYEVARLLTNGQIVARFKGREEFGARALGNRSILADPSNTKVIKIINSMIKCRDFWMPFATSMTDRQADACLNNPKGISAPYMIMTFDTTDLVTDFVAGVHPYDLTVRPQVVYRDWNPSYYRLIELWEEQSGKRGGILNTSFNLHGHPLVSSPFDALDVFNRSGLQYLAIENYLVEKV